MNLALQGSKVARSRGKVPSLHPDPKDAGFQGSKIIQNFQVFKLSGFAPGFSGFHGSRI